MAIFLSILKILLIVILSIIGFALLIVLLVLLCPFRYKVGGEMYEDFAVDASVRWLFIKVLADFTKEKGFIMKLKVFGIPFFSSDKEKKEKKSKKSTDSKKDKDSKKQDKTDSGDSAEITETSGASDTAATETSDTSNITAATESSDTSNITAVSESSDTTDTSDNDKKEDTSIEGDDSSQKESFSVKINRAIDTITEKKDMILTKKDHIEQFLDRPYTIRTIERVKKALISILKMMAPKKGKGYLHIGLNDPADTGELLGMVSPFYWLYERWLTIDPDFNKKVLEGDLHIKGRLILIVIVIPAVRIYFSRDFKKTYALMKKI